MNKTGFYILGFIFLIIIGLLITDIVIRLNSKYYFKSDKCNSPPSDWAAEPGVNYTEVKKQCDKLGIKNSSCVFNNVKNVTEAIVLCQQNINVCERFTYNSSTKTMKIVTLTSNGLKDKNHDSYTMQTGVTFSSGVPTVNYATTVNTDFTVPQPFIGIFDNIN